MLGGRNEKRSRNIRSLGVLSYAASVPQHGCKIGNPIGPRLLQKGAGLEKEFRREPGKAEIDRVISDIWPKQKADRLKSAAAP